MLKGIILLVLLNIIISQSLINNSLHTGGEYFTDDNGNIEYYVDEAGNIFMYVNILGHANKPGAYLVHKGTDLFTILAQAGGPRAGARLDKVVIYSQDSNIQTVNLSSYLEGESLDIVINPNDTIYLYESFSSFILSKGNIVNSLLQVLNIYLTITTLAP